MVGSSDPFYVKFWVKLVKLTPLSENANFQWIFPCSTSAIIASEKSSVNTNRMSTTCFAMSLRWTSYIASKPPKGAQKRKTAVLGLKSHFAWRKSAKFLCVKTVSDKVVRHSLAYLSMWKWLVGTFPYTWKFGGYWSTPCKMPIFKLF